MESQAMSLTKHKKPAENNVTEDSSNAQAALSITLVIDALLD